MKPTYEELELELLEAELTIAELEASKAELRRRIINLSASHGLPRVQDVADIHELKESNSRLKGELDNLLNKNFLQTLDRVDSREKRLQALGFKPVTDDSGGYTAGDALGLPRSPTSPYAVLPNGNQEPLTNCQQCGEMGLAKYSHMHECSILRMTEAEQVVLDTLSSVTDADVKSWLDFEGPPGSQEAYLVAFAEAELARRRIK